MAVPHTDVVCATLHFARGEAEAAGSVAIRPVHLLLGLMRADYSLVAQMLHLPDPERAIAVLRETGGQSRDHVRCDLPLSSESKQALSFASEECSALGHELTGAEHLLLGLLREGRSAAAEFVRNRGWTVERLRLDVSRRIDARLGKPGQRRPTNRVLAEIPAIETALQALPEGRKDAALKILDALSKDYVYVAAVTATDVSSISFSDGGSGASQSNQPHQTTKTSSLTRRESEVLALIGQGKTTKEIADILSISDETIGNHRKKLCRKLNLHTTAELASFAARRSWRSLKRVKR